MSWLCEDFVFLVADFLSVLCAVFRLPSHNFLSVVCAVFRVCYVWCLDAFNPRKRGLARFSRCGRFAAPAGSLSAQMQKKVGRGGYPPRSTGSIRLQPVKKALLHHYSLIIGPEGRRVPFALGLFQCNSALICVAFFACPMAILTVCLVPGFTT